MSVVAQDGSAPAIARFSSLHLSESLQPRAGIYLALVSVTITLFAHPELVDVVREARALQASFAVDPESGALARLQ